MHRLQRLARLGAFLCLAWILLAPAGWTWESCKGAVASESHTRLMEGINKSILFMLGMVFCVLSGFSFLVWSSYRSARKRLEQAGFAPAADVNGAPAPEALEDGAPEANRALDASGG